MQITMHMSRELKTCEWERLAEYISSWYMTHHPALALSFELSKISEHFQATGRIDCRSSTRSPAIPGCLNVSQLCNVREFRMRIREVEIRIDPPSTATAAAAELATEIFNSKGSDPCAS
jgi:hypothetical protein